MPDAPLQPITPTDDVAPPARPTLLCFNCMYELTGLPQAEGMVSCPECGVRAAPFVASTFILWPGYAKAFAWAAAPMVACAAACFLLLALDSTEPPSLLVLMFYAGVLAALIAPFAVGLLRDRNGEMTDGGRSLFIVASLTFNAVIGFAFVALGAWLATSVFSPGW